jgi:hypothetical protein
MFAMQQDSFESDPKIDRVWLFLYLVPVFGCAPALWSLYRSSADRRGTLADGGLDELPIDRAQSGNNQRLGSHVGDPKALTVGRADRREQQVSRVAVTLGGTWLLATLLLGAGSQTTELPEVSTLVASTVVTSSYFLINLWLMVQVLRRRRIWLPGVSDWGDRLP